MSVYNLFRLESLINIKRRFIRFVDPNARLRVAFFLKKRYRRYYMQSPVIAK